MLSSQYELDPEKSLGFSGQGIGFFLAGKGKHLLFGHPGLNVPGATSILVGIPELGLGASIMTNSLNGLEVQRRILTKPSFLS